MPPRSAPRPSSPWVALPRLSQPVGFAQYAPHGFSGRTAVALIIAGFHDVVQGPTGAADPAFDGADGAAADIGRLLVGKTASADQNQRLALFGGQLVHGLAHF